MENNEIAKKLLKKYSQGRCTIQEHAMVEEWYSNHLVKDDSGELPVDFDSRNKEEFLKLERIHSVTKVRKLWYLVGAASIMLFIAGSFFWPKNEQIKRDIFAIRKATLESGTFDQPVLELANGEVIILDSTQPRIIIDINSVSYGNGNKIIDPSLLDPDGINRIITPKGKIFDITLPDSSRVWLNASSSLAYSNRFLTGNREVILKGEAYFEVARDSSRPFRVVSSSQIVSVLGTHFNIKSYDDGEAVKTTLLEGSVQVETNFAKKVILKPNEESSLQNLKDEFEVQRVVAKDAIGWRNGFFIFKNASLKNVLSEFSRWYDVEIIGQIKVDGYEFVGKIDRSLPLDKALEILHFHGVEFRLKNNILVIDEN